MGYAAIAETGKILIKQLREEMVPDVVQNAGQIGMCSPDEKGDFLVGIWLYDIRECPELNNHSMWMLDGTRQKYPSSYVNLYYMITAYSGGDLNYRAQEEHRILGKVIQIWKDQPVIEIPGGNKNGSAPASIELLNLEMEDKMHIWNVPGAGYRTSLFYEAGPIEIESAKIKHVQRVVDITFGVTERGK